ncbi:F-box/WD repeat-containing protein 1A-like [Daphnia carinata]|uniref:F-box/WD repeat-containing protein 1A-like n=1 Tax=Daphnia carinata TaxID=120202 RepID=UPI00257A767E|nr:F-box/WD repeat-containing protein 1A-like [Daphnia carinata]
MADIISLLVKWHMNLIAENILSFLDHTSLQSCEFVSKTWYLVIRNGKLWEWLYRRVSQKKPLLQNLMIRRQLEAKHDTENDEFLYKKLFYAQQTLEQNWSSGQYKTSLKALGEVSVSICTMDACRILYGLRTSPSVPSSIMVWNRWTMESEHYLVGHQEWITDMQICGDLIFCSYYDGTILVWNLKTKEVVQQFQDQEVVDWVVIHAAHGLLITCTSISSGPTDRDTLVTIRRIHSPTEMTIEKTEEISNMKVNMLVSDDNYFAVVLSSSSGNCIKLQLRSVDFQCVHEINNLISSDDSYAYHSGWLVTGSSEGIIKVWNPVTQTCVQTWNSQEKIEDLHLSSRHIITRNADGKLFAWNLPISDCSNLENQPSPSCLFQINGTEEVSIMDPSLIVDELQVLTISVKDIPNTNASSSALTVRDFLN